MGFFKLVLLITIILSVAGCTFIVGKACYVDTNLGTKFCGLAVIIMYISGSIEFIQENFF